MSEQGILEMINCAMERLDKYISYTKAAMERGELYNSKQDADGLLTGIYRGELFDGEENYEETMGEYVKEKYQELREKLIEATTIHRKAKGDIR